MRIDANNNQYAANTQAEIVRKEISTGRSDNEVIDTPMETEKRQMQESEVINAIENANKHFRSYDRRLEFTIHDKTKQIMVKVIDTEDNSIIREIPSEKILDMVAKLWEMSGLFVDEKR